MKESEKAGLNLNIQKTKIKASGPITSWQTDGEKVEAVTDFLCGWWLQPWNQKMLAPWKDSYDKPNQCIQKQRHHFIKKGPHSQSYGFSSSHVQIWKLDRKEGWMPKNWCFQIVVPEKILESPLNRKIKPVNPKGNQPWIFIGRTDVEAETPILWPCDGKSWFTGKESFLFLFPWCWERLRAKGEEDSRRWDS